VLKVATAVLKETWTGRMIKTVTDENREPYCQVTAHRSSVLFLLSSRASYRTHNICEPELRHVKRGKEDGMGKGGQDAFCAVASPPLAGHNVCICNGQRSSEISCDKYTHCSIRNVQRN
jgi:hypothetical protein